MDDATKRELSTAADMAGLQMEFLELLADAMRYRWLRDGRDDWACFDNAWLVALGIYGGGPAELDAAIDAAMAAEVKT